MDLLFLLNSLLFTFAVLKYALQFYCFENIVYVVIVLLLWSLMDAEVRALAGEGQGWVLTVLLVSMVVEAPERQAERGAGGVGA